MIAIVFAPAFGALPPPPPPATGWLRTPLSSGGSGGRVSIWKLGVSRQFFSAGSCSFASGGGGGSGMRLRSRAIRSMSAVAVVADAAAFSFVARCTSCASSASRPACVA